MTTVSMMKDWIKIYKQLKLDEAKLLKELKIKKFDRTELTKKQYELKQTEEELKDVARYLKRLDLIKKVKEYENSSGNS